MTHGWKQESDMTGAVQDLKLACYYRFRVRGKWHCGRLVTQACGHVSDSSAFRVLAIVWRRLDGLGSVKTQQ